MSRPKRGTSSASHWQPVRSTKEDSVGALPVRATRTPPAERMSVGMGTDERFPPGPQFVGNNKTEFLFLLHPPIYRSNAEQGRLFRRPLARRNGVCERVTGCCARLACHRP